MRKHLAVAVGVVSLACGGYLWTNNPASAANNDKPVHSISVSSNTEGITIECHVPGVAGVGVINQAESNHTMSSKPSHHLNDLNKQIVGGAFHRMHIAAPTTDQLETTTAAPGERSTKPLVTLKPADQLETTTATTDEQITKPFVTLNADADCGTVVAIGAVAGIDWFALAAETIGISNDDIQAGIEAGLSIADQAAAHGVSKQAVIDAIVAAETANINQLVTDGELAAEDAANFTADLPTMIEHFVSNVPHFIPGEDMQCFTISEDAAGTTATVDQAVECEAVEAVPALPSEPATAPSR